MVGLFGGKPATDNRYVSTQKSSGTTEANSSENGYTADQQTAVERAYAIQSAYDDLGRPPTARQAAEYVSHGHDWGGFRGGAWDDVLRAAGVPGYDDVVAEAVRERFEDRYPWQDFVVVRAADFADETDLGPSHIGQKLREIAEGERTPAAAEELVVEQCPTGNGHTKWEVSGR